MRWKNEAAYDDIVRAAVASFDWPFIPEQMEAFVKAVIGQESGFDPGALRREPGPAGLASVGLMQVLTSTARQLGYNGPIGERSELTGLFQPGTNIYTGVKFLNQLTVHTGTDLHALASSYNGGWRPNLGFGMRLERELRLCLAKDDKGQCIRWYTGRPGEFGNQPYVGGVMDKYDYFWQGPRRSGGPGLIGVGGVMLAALAAAALLRR